MTNCKLVTDGRQSHLAGQLVLSHLHDLLFGFVLDQSELVLVKLHHLANLFARHIFQAIRFDKLL